MRPTCGSSFAIWHVTNIAGRRWCSGSCRAFRSRCVARDRHRKGRVMFISRKHLSRRTVLRGLGVSLTLPLLDSMVPALTALTKTAAAPVRRLGVVYGPNGMPMPYWYPKGLSEGSRAYLNTISWRTPTTPMPMENDPRAVFERMFGVTNSTDPAARLARLKKDHSILDYVSSDAARLRKIIGPQDNVKVAEYFEAVRDIERRIKKAEDQSVEQLPIVDQPIGIPTDYAEHAKLMMDLLALAYQTDLTRISTFMLGKEVSNRAYPEIGVSDSHHPASHHQDDPGKLERLAKINAYHVEQFAHLVKHLAATPEGDGTMLDHTLLLYGTAISDSNTHFHDDLPIAMVGGKATGVTCGRYVRYPKQPLTNLHIAILEKLGVRIDKLGDSTHKLDGLTDL